MVSSYFSNTLYIFHIPIGHVFSFFGDTSFLVSKIVWPSFFQAFAARFFMKVVGEAIFQNVTMCLCYAWDPSPSGWVLDSIHITYGSADMRTTLECCAMYVIVSYVDLVGVHTFSFENTICKIRDFPDFFPLLQSCFYTFFFNLAWSW